MSTIVKERTPDAVFGTLFDPAVWENPYPFYDELRQEGRCFQADDHLWIVTGLAETHALLRHRGCSSNEKLGAAESEPNEAFDEIMADFLLFLDPPDHTRLRRLVAGAFTARRVGGIEPRARAIVADLLEAAVPTGRLDVVSGLGRPLALQVICELLGVPFDDRDRFVEWGDAMARMIDPNVLRTADQDAAALDASRSFVEYFERLIDKRRDEPTDDLLSELISAESDGDRLTHGELLAVCQLVLVAGFETTVNLVGNGVRALLGHPGAMARLAAESDLLPTAVDELLRYDAPVQMNSRVALEDVEVCGHQIPAGAAIVLFLAAANRDPAEFERPGDLLLDRTPNRHVSFGGGIHHCLGAALARMEGAVALGHLASRFPNASIAEPPTLRTTFTLRGYEELVLDLSA